MSEQPQNAEPVSAPEPVQRLEARLQVLDWDPSAIRDAVQIAQQMLSGRTQASRPKSAQPRPVKNSPTGTGRDGHRDDAFRERVLAELSKVIDPAANASGCVDRSPLLAHGVIEPHSPAAASDQHPPRPVCDVGTDDAFPLTTYDQIPPPQLSVRTVGDKVEICWVGFVGFDDLSATFRATSAHLQQNSTVRFLLLDMRDAVGLSPDAVKWISDWCVRLETSRVRGICLVCPSGAAGQRLWSALRERRRWGTGDRLLIDQVTSPGLARARFTIWRHRLGSADDSGQHRAEMQ